MRPVQQIALCVCLLAAGCTERLLRMDTVATVGTIPDLIEGEILDDVVKDEDEP
jgi:hypothetical protein